MRIKIIPRTQPLPVSTRNVSYVYENPKRKHGKRGSYSETTISDGYRVTRHDNIAKVQTHRPPFGSIDPADAVNDTKHRSFFYSPDKVKAKAARPNGAPERKQRYTVEKVPADVKLSQVKPKKGTIYVR
jgi:hypothetical protein